MCNIKIKKKSLKKEKKIENKKDGRLDIFVLGNQLIKEDSVALRLVPKLKKKFPQINFLEFDPIDDLYSENVIIMDVVEGIDKVEIINDISRLETKKIYSTHDFDVAFLLKLFKKMGVINKAIIIGIPKNLDEKEITKQIEIEIGKLLKEKSMKEL